MSIIWLQNCLFIGYAKNSTLKNYIIILYSYQMEYYEKIISLPMLACAIN